MTALSKAVSFICDNSDMFWKPEDKFPISELGSALLRRCIREHNVVEFKRLWDFNMTRCTLRRKNARRYTDCIFYEIGYESALLMYAAESNEAPIVSCLLESSFQDNGNETKTFTPLMEHVKNAFCKSCEAGALKSVEVFLEWGLPFKVFSMQRCKHVDKKFRQKLIQLFQRFKNQDKERINTS